MALAGALAGGGLSILGSAIGGIFGAKARRAQKKRIEQEQRENEDWYNRRYNEDATQRADAQRMLNTVNESIKARNKEAAGTAAVMGASTESVAASKAANNAALSDTASQIAAQGAARQDAIESQYNANKSALSDQLNQLDENRAKNIAAATTGLFGTAGDIAGGILGGK